MIRRAPVPPQYRPEMAAQARDLALLGLAEVDIAAVFDVTVEVLTTWMASHRALRRAIHEGRALADARVAASLYQSALGRDTAALNWLRHRRPDLWHDRHELALATDPKGMTDEELADELARRGIVIDGDCERVPPPPVLRPDLLRKRLPPPQTAPDPTPQTAPEPAAPRPSDDQLALLMRLNGRTRH